MADLLEWLARTGEGLFAIDLQQRIILWNNAAEEVLGYKATEVLGRPCHEVIAGLNPSGVLECQGECRDLAAARSGEVLPTHALLTRTKEGQARWIHVTCLPLPSSNSSLSMVVHLFRDITQERERAHLLRELVATAEQLKSLDHSPLPVAPPSTMPQELTRREREILGLLAEGASARAIAERLYISLSTVRKHIQSILSKLGVHSRLEAVAFATKNNLLQR